MKTDFVIIGSGLAGLTSAILLSEYGKVLIISKRKLSDSSTNLAQGGIAAVLSPNDSFISHINDTLVAGNYHNDKKAVEFLVQNAPAAIHFLEKNGVFFDKNREQYASGQEAAHANPRIVHSGDITGGVIEKVLLGVVKKINNIKIWDHSLAVDLLVRNKRCRGLSILRENKLIDIFSRATILATGGLGQLYYWTTNPIVSKGDGVAMAYRAGATISDLEFIQFHPTALKYGDSPLFLLSEALRGEGAYIINERGERFLRNADKAMELAPRDIVARAIFEEQKRSNVYLDIRHKGADFIKKRFPGISAALKKRGFDLVNDKVPVTPAAHYSCGGVAVDLYGRTNIEGLLAYGEVSRTGVHGANRLASNSLLEAVVFPRQIPKIINSLPKRADSLCSPRSFSLSPNLYYGGLAQKPWLAANSCISSLKRIMWEKVGILRTKKGLKEAIDEINELSKAINETDGLFVEAIELKNMITVARLISEAAFRRDKSLGAHAIYG